MKNKKRVLFAGSSEFSLPTLKALHEMGVVCVVLAAPDKPAGRKLKIQKNCVAEFATSVSLPLIQPDYLRSEARELIAKYEPDVMVCVAYGKIFGEKFLALFPDGVVNVHPSLLPRFRGPAPVPATILAGDKKTGLTIQHMAREVDSGRIISQTTMAIRDTDTSETLLHVLAQDGAYEIKKLMNNFDIMYSQSVEQKHEEAIYCTKLTSAYGYISWMENAEYLVNIIRAFSSPYGGAKAYWHLKNDSIDEKQVIKLWNAHVVDTTQKTNNAGTVLGVDNQHGILIQSACGIIGCTELQLSGRKRLYWKDFLCGVPTFVNSRLY